MFARFLPQELSFQLKLKIKNHLRSNEKIQWFPLIHGITFLSFSYPQSTTDQNTEWKIPEIICKLYILYHSEQCVPPSGSIPLGYQSSLCPVISILSMLPPHQSLSGCLSYQIDCHSITALVLNNPYVATSFTISNFIVASHIITGRVNSI